MATTAGDGTGEPRTSFGNRWLTGTSNAVAEPITRPHGTGDATNPSTSTGASGTHDSHSGNGKRAPANSPAEYHPVPPTPCPAYNAAPGMAATPPSGATTGTPSDEASSDTAAEAARLPTPTHTDSTPSKKDSRSTGRSSTSEGTSCAPGVASTRSCPGSTGAAPTSRWSSPASSRCRTSTCRSCSGSATSRSS
ncbi:hypothetical protein [Actinophytocola oryzae]|uniref:hypothetical protein n=1 Tax=Actinophytocola oryzae TaxID=502181 RepID=UPI001063B70F|nr:hypothetical protein [Actinophytocola oryzae]